MPLTGREKATILLSILGTDLSAKIMSYLPSEFADLIAQGIDHLPKPTPEALAIVLDDFTSFVALAKAPIRKVIEENGIPSSSGINANNKSSFSRNHLDTVFYAQPKKIAIALSAERIPTIAFVMSHLPQVQSDEVVSYMSERKREIESAIRNLKKPPISEIIKTKVMSILAGRLERLSA